MKIFVLPMAAILLIGAINASFVSDCTNMEDGLYSLGNCEPRFLTCSGGIARIMDCPDDLVYHEKEQLCDWRHNVFACGVGERFREQRSGSPYGSAEEEPTNLVTPGNDSPVAETTMEAETTTESSEMSYRAEEGSDATPSQDEAEIIESSGESSGDSYESETTTTDAPEEVTTTEEPSIPETYAPSTEPSVPAEDSVTDTTQSEYKSAAKNEVGSDETSTESSGNSYEGVTPASTTTKIPAPVQTPAASPTSTETPVSESTTEVTESSGNYYGSATDVPASTETPVQTPAASPTSTVEPVSENTTEIGETTMESSGSYYGSVTETSATTQTPTPTPASSPTEAPVSKSTTQTTVITEESSGNSYGKVASSTETPAPVPTPAASSAQVQDKSASEPTPSADEFSGDDHLLHNVCEYRGDGVYSSGVCTNSYFVCTSNSPRFLTCTTPLLYNPSQQKCSWRETIEECKQEIVSTTEAEATTQENFMGYGGYEDGEGSGETTPTCDGRADGIYPISECSTNFLTCSGGIARTMDCPSSLFFNPSQHVCDWQRNVVGCSGHSTPASQCDEDGYFSFGHCSSSFTACTNGNSIVMFCPSGLKFSQANQMCDYEHNVQECEGGSGEGSGEPSADATNYGNEVKEDAMTPCVSMENGLYALECTPRVLSCQNGHEDIFECPGSLVFNEQSLICDFPETSLKCQSGDHLLVRDSAVSKYDCSVDGVFSSALCSRSYNKCSNGQLIKHECADFNAVFSSIHAKCVDASYLPQCQ